MGEACDRPYELHPPSPPRDLPLPLPRYSAVEHPREERGGGGGGHHGARAHDVRGRVYRVWSSELRYRVYDTGYRGIWFRVRGIECDIRV